MFSQNFLDADSRNNLPPVEHNAVSPRGSCGLNMAQCNLKLPRCKLWLDKESKPEITGRGRGLRLYAA